MGNFLQNSDFFLKSVDNPHFVSAYWLYNNTKKQLVIRECLLQDTNPGVYTIDPAHVVWTEKNIICEWALVNGGGIFLFSAPTPPKKTGLPYKTVITSLIRKWNTPLKPNQKF